MSDTRTVPNADLEEMLDESIPCAGIGNVNCRRDCSKAADLRWSNPHPCAVTPIQIREFKCAECWMVLYQHLANRLAKYGALQCMYCGQKFPTVLALTDYRPF